MNFNARTYLWTGDKAYLNDPVLWNYVVNTMTKFIAANPGPVTNPIPIPEADSQSITAGIATYNEQSNVTEAEAGDGVASQYAAYVAAAGLAAAKGDTALATQWRRSAAGAVLQQHVERGPQRAASGPDLPPNIEATTYLPDLFLASGEPGTTWQWMQYIYNHRNDPHEGGQYLNGDYPEVSFTTYAWKAGLPGVHSTLLVNGKPRAAHTEVSNGATYSYVTVQVAPHQSASVRS
jgi:hypothetical protein